jgi:hypothetical protein
LQLLFENMPRIPRLHHILAGLICCLARPMATIHCSRCCLRSRNKSLVSETSEWYDSEAAQSGLMLLRRCHVSKPSGALVFIQLFAYLDSMSLAIRCRSRGAGKAVPLLWHAIIILTAAQSKQPALKICVICCRAKLQHGQCTATLTALWS